MSRRDGPPTTGKGSEMAISVLKRARNRQIALCTRVICRLQGKRPVAAIMTRLRSIPGIVPLLHGVFGYHRPYPTLAQARSAIGPYEDGGHENPENAALHLKLAELPRPSDYAALYHLARRSDAIASVFDLGGNVGNLYYLYRNYLDFPAGFTWTVCDLPGIAALGEKLASQRGVRQLAFVTEIPAQIDADLLLMSGSFHYFDPPVHHRLSAMPRKPRFVLINRSPMLEGRSASVIQFAARSLVACTLYDRLRVEAEFGQMGYRLVDRWSAGELSVRVPFYPEYAVPAYSGMFFELQPAAIA